MLTKRKQCPTCKFNGCGCFSSCEQCSMHSEEPLITMRREGSRIISCGFTHCKCLSIELDRFCPYYKKMEVTADDQDKA